MIMPVQFTAEIHLHWHSRFSRPREQRVWTSAHSRIREEKMKWRLILALGLAALLAMVVLTWNG